MDQKNVEVIKWEKEAVSADVYDDLLSRYEKVLLYAGQLQEKNRQQLLLQERTEDLQKENELLKRRVAVEESYARLLERALTTLGISIEDDSTEPSQITDH